MAADNELAEIKENQRRLADGQVVLSEMLEDLLKEVKSRGIDGVQVKFRGHQQELSGHRQSVGKSGAAHRGPGTGKPTRHRYWQAAPAVLSSRPDCEPFRQW